MDTQTAYEKIRAYFSKPGAVLAKRHGFTDDNGEIVDTSCEYLTPDGRKCAVGCLIPPAMYTEEIENKDWGNAAVILRERNPVKFVSLFGDVESGFLQAAQSAHDGEAESAADFVAILDEVAAQFDLAVVGAPAREDYDHYDDPASDDFRVP